MMTMTIKPMTSKGNLLEYQSIKFVCGFVSCYSDLTIGLCSLVQNSKVLCGSQLKCDSTCGEC